ncbi:hypothetical protein Tco_0595700 [Tanacetum coccineum]
MLLVATNQIAGQEHEVVAPTQPSSSTPPVPSTSSPPAVTAPTPIPVTPPPPIPTPTPPPIPTPTLPPIPTPTPPPIPSPTPIPDNEPTQDEHIYEEQSPVYHHFSPPPAQASSRMPMDDLLQAVPNEASQEGEEVGRVTKKEEFSFDNSRIEEPDAKGGKVKMILQDSSISRTLLLPTTKVQASGEEQEEDISPKLSEAAKTLSKTKLEANAELSKSMLGSELQGEDFAKRMVDLVNQRKKLFAEERAKAKRNKPMTQSQLKTYMMNYLKNQGTWKINQLKKLSFEEVKEEFDKLVKQIESFAPISFEATKASLKRFGEELQTKTPKRLKEDKDDEQRMMNPRKNLEEKNNRWARKGMNTSVDENDSEDSDKIWEDWPARISAKGLTSPEQTATGKGISNPLMAVMVCQKPYGIQLTNVSSTES